MQAIIIYYSSTGNTAQAAKYIKKGLEDENIIVISLNVHKAKQEDIVNKNIVIFGTPNHAGSPALLLRKFLNNLPETALRDKKVSTFCTYWLSKGTVISDIEEICQDKGATNIIPGKARRASILRNIWNVITGSVEDELVWTEFGRTIAHS